GGSRIIWEQFCHLSVDRQRLVAFLLGQIGGGEQVLRLSSLRPLLRQRLQQLHGRGGGAFSQLEFSQQHRCLIETRLETYRFVQPAFGGLHGVAAVFVAQVL